MVFAVFGRIYAVGADLCVCPDYGINSVLSHIQGRHTGQPRRRVWLGVGFLGFDFI